MQQDNSKAYLIEERQQDYYQEPAKQQMQYPPLPTYTPPPTYPPQAQQQQFSAPQNVPYQTAPPQQGQPQIIVVNQGNDNPHSVMLCNQSKFPILITCPYCKKEGITRIEFVAGSGTWLCCYLLFLFCYPLCCWIPFVSDSCRDANHMCNTCGALVGSCPYKVCG
ncbi:unnamed protein product [Paramecium sonneborni]|uniref:LITAF domain-containing protein n=1 Tax=Paramecium sonneborni TaxID=65129 RepID=A0A8S1R1D3_9CILI|nr:unnamed protein product [Paramecium sonneborni]CAD8121912.1 unnamed protein product [Paramecium sonneborni]